MNPGLPERTNNQQRDEQAFYQKTEPVYRRAPEIGDVFVACLLESTSGHFYDGYQGAELLRPGFPKSK